MRKNDRSQKIKSQVQAVKNRILEIYEKIEELGEDGGKNDLNEAPSSNRMELIRIRFGRELHFLENELKHLVSSEVKIKKQW